MITKLQESPTNLLICGEAPQVPQFLGVDTHRFTHSKKIKDFDLSQGPLVAAVFADTYAEAKEFLDFLSDNVAFATLVLVSPKIQMSELIQITNQYQISRWVQNMTDFKSVISEAVSNSETIFNRGLLRRELTSQMRELEHLTQDLENLVLERTQHIETSRLQEEEKLNRIRNVIRFIKELSLCISLEEILVQVRRDLKRFPRLGDPFIIVQSQTRGLILSHFKGGQAVYEQREACLSVPDDLSYNAKELTLQLANLLGRPFAKTIVIPIEVKLFSSLIGEEVRAVIGVENSLSEKEQEDFIDFVMERLQPIAMTVDRFLLEEDLTRSSLRWEKTFDGMRDPIAIIDSEFNVLRANNKFSDKVSLGKCYEVFAEKKSPCENCPLHNSLESQSTLSETIKINGRLYDVHSHPIKITDEGAETVVHQYVDVTQSRELYLRLLQNEKMSAIGLLAGNIAHELNNPLTGLGSLAQILKEESPPESSLRQDLDEIVKATQRSQLIIKNLLDFSQGQTNHNQVISLSELVTRTMPFLKTVIRLHRVSIELSPNHDKVVVEPHLMQQVIFNLINNACQAMKEKGKLDVRVFANERTVTLEVQDSGPGISEELKEKIFEPFFTTKTKEGGTGLGLSLTKKIVESFDGKIEFYSNKETPGVTFRVSLPVAQG